MVEAGHATYIDRFYELARLVPHLVTPESRKIERYVYGLAPQIRRMVVATEPKTMQKAVQIFGAMTDEAVRNGSIKKNWEIYRYVGGLWWLHGGEWRIKGVFGSLDPRILTTPSSSPMALMNVSLSNPKEYDGKGGDVVLTRWIEKIESVQDMSGCSIDQKVKYIAGSCVGKALTWWNSQIRTLSWEVTVSMSWNEFKFMMIKEFCPSHEMQKLETKLWNHVMVEAGHAAYTDRFHELARLVPHLVTPKSRKIERYVYGLASQIRSMVAATEPKIMQKVVQISSAMTDEAVRNGSIKKVDKRGNVGEPSKDKNGRDDNKRTRTGNVFATTVNPIGRDNTGSSIVLFPSILYLCLGIVASELGFRYEIEIASRQLVEIDKVIKGCKLEIEGHFLDIDLIPFGYGSFDVIIGMDWLSNHKAKIICHEKVARIPLLDSKVLRVLGERSEEKARLLMSAKASDKKQEEIIVVTDFPMVFLNDLSGLPPLQEIEF
ncbi:reverse transcriptase domain-containing protein [Tanacetum coccineum]|uniref:Reverse transcriptase domain-containing protein n=1 Tax=Tanacetum coccineum TaxID=301880 RepID=A0ABQ5ETM5_9ASTR